MKRETKNEDETDREECPESIVGEHEGCYAKHDHAQYFIARRLRVKTGYRPSARFCRSCCPELGYDAHHLCEAPIAGSNDLDVSYSERCDGTRNDVVLYRVDLRFAL